MLYNKTNPFSFSARNDTSPLDQKIQNTLKSELPMVDSDRDLSLERRLKNIVANEPKDFSEAQKCTNYSIKTNRLKKTIQMSMRVRISLKAKKQNVLLLKKRSRNGRKLLINPVNMKRKLIVLKI